MRALWELIATVLPTESFPWAGDGEERGGSGRRLADTPPPGTGVGCGHSKGTALVWVWG